MDRITTKLGIEKSKLSTNVDQYLKINLEGKERILPSNDINRIVNVGDQFDLERQTSPYYRILGSINLNASNILFNLDDVAFNNEQTLKGFNNYEFLDTSYPRDNDLVDLNDINYAQSITANLKEIDGWFGYYNPDRTKEGLCEFIDMEPTRDRFKLTPDSKSFSNQSTVKNWELSITYPATTNKTHNLVRNGLLIIDIQDVVVSDRNMKAFMGGSKHGLSVGDTVLITGTQGYNLEFQVVRLGLDNGDLLEYYFVIDSQITGSIGPDSRFKKLIGGQPSEYYFRIFNKVKTKNSLIIENDDYEIYKLGFSKNIFNDDLTQYVFNEDINVSGLTDNLGRPVSELYLTIIKTDSDDLFTGIKSGIELPIVDNLKTSKTKQYLRDVPAINMIHNGGSLPFPSHNGLETNLNISSNQFYGDIVEYNKFSVQETILSVVNHRFNTLNREMPANISYVAEIGDPPKLTNIDLGPRQEGYTYQPHYLMQIREFSSYIEQGDDSVIGIPDYAENLGDGRYLWRDLLDIGVSNGVTTLDYPFLNNSHYLHDEIILNVKRQDPFNNLGLYYSKFPSDILGDTITEKFIVKTEDDVC